MNFQCKKALFPMLRRFVFSGTYFLSFLSLVSPPSSSPPPRLLFSFLLFLFSSPRGLPLSLLCLCSVLLSSFLYFALLLVAAAVAALLPLVAAALLSLPAAGCCVAVAVGAGAAVVSRFGAVFFCFSVFLFIFGVTQAIAE